MLKDFRKRDNVEKFRLPNEEHVRNMLPAVRQRNTLAAASLEGLFLLGERNPEKVFM